MITGYGKRLEEGARFGRLTVTGDLGIRLAKSGKYRKHYYSCVCDCGTTVETQRGQLLRGIVRSCGCLFKEQLLARNTTHGRSSTKLFKVWQGVISRCEIQTASNYPNYGGRGISVCPRWRKSFEAFLTDMGDRPTPKHTLERVNTNGNYEPSNCRWATRLEQSLTSRRTVTLTLGGVSAPQSYWARASEVPHATLARRLKAGWSLDRALSEKTRLSGRGGRDIESIVSNVRQQLSEAGSF